ncbi:MAG: glycosyltransferase family 39 protein [Nitrospirota bacterium]
MENRRYKFLFILIMLAVTLLRILYIKYGPLDLSTEEAQYWEWSRRLDLSYYSKGPMVAYIIYILTKIGGNTELAVRTGAVVISILISILLYIFTKDIFKSERAAFFAGVVPQVTPLFAAGSILMTIDPPFILFWGLSIYFLRKAVTERENIFWYLTGIAIGFGLLSKYTMAMFYPLVFLFLLLSKKDRHWLIRKEPYLAFIISIIIFSPVIIWNIQHDWVTVKHVIGQANVPAGFRASSKWFIEFIVSQVGIITPLVFAGILYAMIKSGQLALKNPRDHLLLFLTSAPVIIFFALKSLQGKVQANWPAHAYFTAFVSVSGIFEGLYLKKRGIRIFVISAIFIGIILTGFAHYPQISSLFGIELKPKMNPTNRLIGWEEVGHRTGTIYREMSERNHTFIFSDSYHVAGELAFYVPENPVTYNVNLGRRMNQYDLWEGFNNFIKSDAIFVKMGGDDFPDALKVAFSRYEKEPFYIYRSGKQVREFSIFRCYDFKGLKIPIEKLKY